jgi:hypothetical protein
MNEAIEEKNDGTKERRGDGATKRGSDEETKRLREDEIQMRPSELSALSLSLNQKSGEGVSSK